MPSIEIRPNAKFAVEEILSGISKLDTESLEKFVDEILAIRAKRLSKGLSKKETALLKKINRGLTVPKRERLAKLESKRMEGALSPKEHKELMAIVEELEQLNAERIEHLGVLASLRKTTVRELMEQLDIHPRPYA